MKKEVKIPEISESVETGLIASILVSEGDEVEKEQPLVEVETDKATTDIPSPFAGVIDEIKVSEGDEVKVNQVIMIMEVKEKGEEEEGEEEEKEEEGPSEKEEKARKEKAEKEKKEKGDKKKEAEEEPEEEDKEPEKEEKKGEKEPEKEPSDIPAAPSVRRLAREKGVDLAEVKGSGPQGRITAADVEKVSGKGAAEEARRPETEELPDFSNWGDTTREPMKNIRRRTADSMTRAWQTIPHVTQFDEADMTRLEEFRQQNKEFVEAQGGKLTITALLLKISAFALQKFPDFNASIDMDNKEIVYKKYYHIGIAVDTPQGLLVPVVRDVDRKSVNELSVEITELAKKARDKKISPDELQGGNFTISNLGGIGGTAFTPIVYPPQVAILGVSEASYKQVLVGDTFRKRMIIPLSLSYDHRVIDGANGARFLRWICNVIENPFAILQ